MIDRVPGVARSLLTFKVVLLFVSLAYIAAYFGHPVTPGNSPQTHPLGWWGAYDQGQYLLSARSLAAGDFSPTKHFYPPLYPALGAVFIKWSSGHMYFVFDLVALVWFSFVFIRFSDQYLPRWGSVAIFLGTTVLSKTQLENYVIPWTSTLSVALLATGILGLVWLKEVREGARHRIKARQIIFVGMCLGLLVPTRPVDAPVGAVIGIGLLIGYWSVWRVSPQKVPGVGRFLILAAGSVSVGPLVFLGFNFGVYGTLFGSYMQVAANNGYYPADLAEKFVSLWLNGTTLYGETRTGLTENYPWLLVSLAGIVWVLFRGDLLLRVVAVAVCTLFLLYMPYGDLLPNGLWRYRNIHYFKWTFPFLALLGLVLVIDTVKNWREGKDRLLPTFLLVVVPFMLLSIYITVSSVTASTQHTGTPNEIVLDLPRGTIDLIDFTGIFGGFNDVYFGSHELVLDDKKLKRVRDYRVLPMKWGIRVLFIRPVQGNALKLVTDSRLNGAKGGTEAVRVGTYRFSLGVLKQW